LVLEFTVEPASLASRVLRHPAIAAARGGRRARGGADEVIWLDDAAGTLADAGLALVRPRRGGGRLCRIGAGGSGPWVPGTPATPVEGDGNGAAATGVAGLVPVAAFSFRRSALALSTEAGPVEAELLAGTLRAVAAERPAARLRLAGGRDAVLDLSARLALDLPLLPPRAALAEEGRALAREGDGAAPRPRHRGAPDLAGASSVEDGLLRALGHLLDVMLHQAPECRLGAGPEGVHQLRVALRRLRSVLKAFRPAVRGPALEGLDEDLKALARRLGPARDWDVFLAGLSAEAAAALGEDRRLLALKRAATAKRDAAYGALRRELEGPGFRRLMLDGMSLLLRRPWRAEADGDADGSAAAEVLDAPLAEFAAPLLDKRWRKLQEGGDGIGEHSFEALHELRLEAKRLRYASELFAPLWGGKTTRRFLKRLAALQEALGTVNDAAVARSLLAALDGGAPAWAAGAVEGFAAARVGPARESALSRWEDVAAAKAFWVAAPGT
jgi:triphosphatase